ncbi:helix-turn-helix domain-containing protein [Candidatus Pacearchaeota archaeon]|nr:helix-turn-helix domain-containing protein [Candidatus Pacearchaeota archaeon]
MTGNRDIYTRIRKNILYLRSANGYTQKDLAERSGVSYSNLAKIESGRGNQRGVGSLETLEKIATAFDMPTGALIDLDFEAFTRDLIAQYNQRLVAINKLKAISQG